MAYARPLRAIAVERLLELTPAFHRHNDRAHPVALGENELLDFAVLELSEQRAEIAHRLADGAELVGADAKGGGIVGHVVGDGRRGRGRMTTKCRRIVGVPSEGAVNFSHAVEPMQDDASLVSRLAHGEGSALEPLMEVWGDHLLDTWFRALRDARRALDLYGEVWATIYDRLRYGTQPLPKAFGPWAVEIIADLLEMAASEGRIPDRARHRMKLAPHSATAADIERIDALCEPNLVRAARGELPGDFSAAADRMLLRMPGPTAISRIRPSAEGHP